MRVWGPVLASVVVLVAACGGRSTTADVQPDASAGNGGTGGLASGGSGGHGTGGYGTGGYGAGGTGTGGHGTGGYGAGGTGGYGAGGTGGYGAGGTGGYGAGGTGGYGTGGGPGSCGGANCGLQFVCINGQCRCPPPLQFCGGSCIDVMFDPNNCGACGKACPTGQCNSGACPPVGGCDPNFCPSNGIGVPCCMSPVECGIDYGMGCVSATGDGGP